MSTEYEKFVLSYRDMYISDIKAHQTEQELIINSNSSSKHRRIILLYIHTIKKRSAILTDAGHELYIQAVYSISNSSICINPIIKDLKLLSSIMNLINNKQRLDKCLEYIIDNIDKISNDTELIKTFTDKLKKKANDIINIEDALLTMVFTIY